MSPPAASSARRAHSQSPAQALTRRRNASSVAQRRARSSTARLIARQADRAVDVADGTGSASSSTPHPAAEQAGPQVLRAPVAAALSSPPPDPLPGLAAALRGLTHQARFSHSVRWGHAAMISYHTDDEGVVSQPEYTLPKPSNGPNDRDHLIHPRGRAARLHFGLLDRVPEGSYPHAGPRRSRSPRTRRPRAPWMSGLLSSQRYRRA